VLESHVDLLAETAKQTDAPQSRWAEAGLLVLLEAKDVSPEHKAIADAAVEQGWANPRRRVQIMDAALLANARSLEARVRIALKDPDAAVASAAQRVADQWKLAPMPTPAGPRLKTMKPEDVLAAAIEEKGDVARGEQVFVRLQCSKCHTVKAGEALRGPHLPQVVKTYKRNQLVESILLPSKSIAQGFVTTLFVLDSGKTRTGFVTSEAADVITIRDNEGKEFRIPVDSIEERARQPISMMPAGLVDEIDMQDFVSLIDYLESLRE
jgi:putative heme-binding domain-containing protein